MPPIDHELNLTTQAVLTYASWGLTAVILIVAVQWGRRERTVFYPLIVLAAMIGAFAEPLYDVAMNLYFYSTAGMWTHFTAFGIPQPIWTHSGYVVLYASAALYVAREMGRGTLTVRKLFILAGAELTMSAVFEIYAINAGAYSYWGPHTFRIFEYPLVIGVLEAAQVICFALGAALLRAHVTRQWQLLALFVIFPCTFFGANFGAGWPTIIAINLEQPFAPLTAMASLVSIGLAVALVRMAGALLPAVVYPSSGQVEYRSGGVGEQNAQSVLGQAGVVK